MVDGIVITQLVYENLRKPSETVLPHKTVLNKIAEVIRKKKLDLALADQNALLNISNWFTPSSNNFAVNGKGGISNIILPVRVERRAIGSNAETGEEVPLVNYTVLNTSDVGAASFFGSPLKMAFRNSSEFVFNQEYRIAYEADFTDPVALNKPVLLPDYFMDMVAAESTYLLMMLVIDNSPEWTEFLKRYSSVLETNIADWRNKWTNYVHKFKGKAQIPKRTFFGNRRCRTNYYDRPVYLNED